jgi:hypothetical protein
VPKVSEAEIETQPEPETTPGSYKKNGAVPLFGPRRRSFRVGRELYFLAGSLLFALSFFGRVLRTFSTSVVILGPSGSSLGP